MVNENNMNMEDETTIEEQAIPEVDNTTVEVPEESTEELG